MDKKNEALKMAIDTLISCGLKIDPNQLISSKFYTNLHETIHFCKKALDEEERPYLARNPYRIPYKWQSISVDDIQILAERAWYHGVFDTRIFARDLEEALRELNKDAF